MVCHNDLAPSNTIYRDGQPVAFIDWDVAAPAPPLWDIAHAVWRFVDITRNADTMDVRTLAARTRLFCDAYGLSRPLVACSTPYSHANTRSTRRSATLAGAGDPAFVAMWGTKHSDGPLRDAEFLRRHRREFTRALA